MLEKNLFQTKKTFLKNDKDNFDITNRSLDDKYKKIQRRYFNAKKTRDFQNKINLNKP